MPRPRLELLLVGCGHVARRAIGLIDELRGRLPFDVRILAIVTGRHGGAWSPEGVDAAAAVERLESGGRLDAWPSSLPRPADRGGSNAEVITALAARHAHEAGEGRLVCVETTVLDVAAGEPASSHVRAALDADAHVVTANKGPAAFAYEALSARARARGREFLFEGAVMDGIPIFNLVRETLPGVRIEGFRGVINSTTNEILTCLERGDTFESALARMQAAGIAEADPALDIDGWDAAAKTAVLMNVLMGARITPHDVEREGIGGVTAEHVREAAAGGRRIRLVASAGREGDRPRGRVRLERVPAGDPLGALEGQQNALVLRTDVLGEIGIVQREGGLTQTAYALVTDLATIARRAARP
jgi:homoserine dehydrogenase